jgi:hypothetical protein
MTIAKRGTLLIVSGPRHDPDRKHLYVICNDPDSEGNVLIVSIASVTAATHDTTCILQPHEHDFLKRASYTYYAKAEIRSAAALLNGVKQQAIFVHSNMNAQAFLRLTNGICRSPYTPRKIKRYFGCAEPEAAA